MSFQEFIEECLDELLPMQKGSSDFLSLKYMEDRHILRAFLITGAKSSAAPMLDACVRTINNRLNEMFPPEKILALPGNRGRTDTSYLIEHIIKKMPPDLKVPRVTAESHVWKTTRLRVLRPHISEEEIEEIMTKKTSDPLEYPCHRDFRFWDWYQNLDTLKKYGPTMSGERSSGER